MAFLASYQREEVLNIPRRSDIEAIVYVAIRLDSRDHAGPDSTEQSAKFQELSSEKESSIKTLRFIHTMYVKMEYYRKFLNNLSIFRALHIREGTMPASKPGP